MKFRSHYPAVIFLSCFFIVSSSLPGFAETVCDKTLSPYFFIETKETSTEQFPLKSTDVRADISGVIADVLVMQTYENTGRTPINARYIFPASTRAAVHGMQMTIGENVITAKVMERKSAERKFEEAKKEGKGASLLNQERPNVFSMQLANIMPGDTLKIELRYSELLVPVDGTYEFVYPTVVGPRYADVPESSTGKGELWVKNPYLKAGEQDPSRFQIHVNVSGGIPLKEVECSTHKTETVWQDEKTAGIRLSDGETSGGNRDFILHYRLAGYRIESGLLLYEGEEENFFLMMVQPPETVTPEDIPPREYIFVVDISGSMNGFPLNTAKELLKDLIGGLTPADKFNVILFAGGSKVMAPESVAATGENIRKALTIIDDQRGGGGTELYRALEKGLELPRDEGVSRTMLMISDGYISAEHEVFELISKNLAHTNLFAFGIGSSVNRYLIEGMARAGLGEPFVVTDPAETRKAAEKFREYVASPVLTDIGVDFDDFGAYDVEPESIPDLFAKRPVILFGKYHGEPAGRIRLSGKTGQGGYEQVFDVSRTPTLGINQPISRLWARNRIARLSDYNPGRAGAENRAEITSLGMTYNLLTAYTSFVAVHDVIRNPEKNAEDVKQPLPLPRNVSNLAVGGMVRAVPEPELGYLLLAMGLFSAVMRLKRKA